MSDNTLAWAIIIKTPLFLSFRKFRCFLIHVYAMNCIFDEYRWFSLILIRLEISVQANWQGEQNFSASDFACTQIFAPLIPPLPLGGTPNSWTFCPPCFLFRILLRKGVVIIYGMGGAVEHHEGRYCPFMILRPCYFLLKRSKTPEPNKLDKGFRNSVYNSVLREITHRMYEMK